MPNGLFRIFKPKKKEKSMFVEQKLQQCLSSKDREIANIKETEAFKQADPKIKKQVNELEKIKTKKGLSVFIQKHFKKIPKGLVEKEMLTKEDVKGLSFIERQALGFLRARKNAPVQSRLTVLALGLTPIVPLPLAIALTT